MASLIIHNPRIRSRGDSDPTATHTSGQKPTTLRRRPSLESLFDDDYKKYVHDSFAWGEKLKRPWQVEPDEVLDTIPKAQAAYYHAHYRLKLRYTTPITRAFLQEYESSLEEFLRDPTDIARKAAVNTANRIYHSKAFLRRDPHPHTASTAKAIEELARLRYYADYGDYVAHVCTSFRQAATAAKVDNVDILIGKSWGKVRDVLKKEDEETKNWQMNVRIPPSPPCPMTGTIAYACTVLDLEYANIRYCIDWYAARNDKAHSGVPFYIKNCDWDKLATQLWRDLQEVPNVFGRDDQSRMTHALQKIRDKFFDELTATSNIPSKLATDLGLAKAMDAATRAQNRRENKRKGMQAINRRAREAEEKKERKAELELIKEQRKKEREDKSTSESYMDAEEYCLPF
ncbi:MAG: hypothetical protein Q9166_006840 [cf. Caloplaca sp. 2 TL-2023]